MKQSSFSSKDMMEFHTVKKLFGSKMISTVDQMKIKFTTVALNFLVNQDAVMVTVDQQMVAIVVTAWPKLSIITIVLDL